MRSSRAYGTTGRRSHCRAWRALLMCRFAGLHNASTGAHLRVQRARAQERCASQCVGRTALTSTKLSSRHLRAATGDAYDEVWLQRPQPLERAPSETPFSQQLKFDYKVSVGSLSKCLVQHTNISSSIWVTLTSFMSVLSVEISAAPRDFLGETYSVRSLKRQGRALLRYLPAALPDPPMRLATRSS